MTMEIVMPCHSKTTILKIKNGKVILYILIAIKSLKSMKRKIVLNVTKWKWKITKNQ
jgi:hypothetical protein